ncbi:MAG: hypothetical protein WC205_18550 [Opitutaceae bacterium]
MAITLRYLITTLGLWSVVLSAFAQVSPVEKPKEVTLQFSVFSLAGMENLTYVPKAKAELSDLKFYSAYRSPAYTYHGGSRLCFFEGKETGADKLAVAIYDVPEGASKLLLLFFPKSGGAVGGLKYDVYGVDDRIEKAPRGSFSIINVSGREYVAQYGASRISIPQGVSEAHAARGRISLRLAAQIEGGWMSTGRHDFSVSTEDRVTLILYPPGSATGIYPIIRRLTDTLPPEAGKTSDLAQYP